MNRIRANEFLVCDAYKKTRLMEWTPPPKDGIDVPR